MKILFIHPNTPDYLISGLFHGLRELLGANCLDIPRFDGMYKPYTEAMRAKIRGKGFTLYGLLNDIPELASERFFIWHKNIKDYDYYIIADVWHQMETYRQLEKIVSPNKIVIIDPADSPRLYPFSNLRSDTFTFLKNLFKPIHPATIYFKREYTGKLKDSTGLPILFANVLGRFFLPRKVFSISFSIPVEKISPGFEKRKTFVTNIVDEEISKAIEHSFYTPQGKEVYVFETEQAYYSDIQESKFGITTKRSGWDCLRHYELAANGAVLCFKDLEYKPEINAPFGLTRQNCIIYNNYSDLMQQIDSLNEMDYKAMQKNSIEWVKEQSTKALAQRVLNILKQ